MWTYWNPFRLFVQNIPIKYMYVLGKVIGLIAYYLLMNKRYLLDVELKKILIGDEESPIFGRTIKDAFIILCQSELEVLIFPKLNEKNIHHLVDYTGLEYLDAALSAGKGAMLLFAHFGANQMIMPAIGYRGYRLSQLSAPATVWQHIIPGRNFSKMERFAMEKRWSHELSLPVEHINIFGSLKRAFLCLRQNNVLGVAIDGNWGKERITVDFIKRRANFSVGALELSRRTGCPVLPTFILRNADGRNHMIIEAPIEISGFEGDQVITQSIRSFVGRLEHYVVNYPSHYLNFMALRSRMEKVGDMPLFTQVGDDKL